MKRFKENFNQIDENINGLNEEKNFSAKDFNEDSNEYVNENNLEKEISYKRLEEEKESDLITPSMKTFRKVVGGIVLALIAYSFIFSRNLGTRNYMSNLESGKIEGIVAGDIISKEAIKLDSKDFTIETANGYGSIEISVWNFSDNEDGDYVQVFVNGSPHTEPFSIRHKPIKVGVPDDAVIQVKGIRDGGNNGITYGVFFNKTGETYLNTVPLNASNTYTLKTR